MICTKKQQIEHIEGWIQEVRIEIKDEEEAEDGEWMESWYDMKGGNLKWKEVVEARGKEIDFMVKRGMWEVRPRTECWEKTGKNPTGVRWVDTNKGSDEETDVRSRLVARDFKNKADKGREDLYLRGRHRGKR